MRHLSFLSISARLVFALMRIMILGLKDDPSVSADPRACTCPITRSSPNGRRCAVLPTSTMPLGPSDWYSRLPLPGRYPYVKSHRGATCVNAMCAQQCSEAPLYLWYLRVTPLTPLVGSHSPNGLRRWHYVMQLDSSQGQNLSCSWHDDMLNGLPDPPPPHRACEVRGPLTSPE